MKTTSSKTGRIPRRCFALGAGFCFLLFILLGTLHPATRSTVLDLMSDQSSLSGSNVTVEEIVSAGSPVHSEIPNIIHYVHILPPPDKSQKQTIEFKFSNFISVYSAYLYTNPDAIYIHTNGGEDLVQQAKNSSNQWTRSIANLPMVQFKYTDLPTKTNKGLEIAHWANRADFVRTRVVSEYGGVYIDEDIYIVKDLAPLRRSGFQNVVGRQQGGWICNGMFMSMPGSDMAKAFYGLQDSAFDGGWSTHGVELLTRLASEFAAREGQVLIMEQWAFFPESWEWWGLKDIYELHDAKDMKGEDIYSFGKAQQFNLTTFMKDFVLRPSWSWRIDWRQSYAVHGWNSQTNGQLFGEFKGITMEYVLARNSNFARAVYPALKHALDTGVIKQK
jgi:Glycosyltransferase sugar-binding region containing DXD motif